MLNGLVLALHAKSDSGISQIDPRRFAMFGLGVLELLILGMIAIVLPVAALVVLAVTGSKKRRD